MGDNMEKKSIWLKNKKKSNLTFLNKDLNVDVLIIGGGLTGFSSLYSFLKTPLKVCLVERGNIGEGVTGKSTAKLNYLQGIVYSNICKNVNYESAKAYLRATKEGISFIKKDVEENKIDCNLEQVTSFLYGKEKDKKNILEEYLFLKKEGCPITLEENTLKVTDTFVFHPIKYLYALKDLCLKKTKHIYENSLVTKLTPYKDGYLCDVNNHQVFAKKVVLACHYPFDLFPFFLPVKSYIEKSYIMAIPTAKDKLETFITTPTNILSKRYLKEKENTYEIILKGSHNICNNWNELENFRALIGNNNPKCVWSNEDIMTSDMLPFIGKIEKNLYLATGYNTWGMAMSRIAGEIIKDLICEKENPYTIFFNPHRPWNLGKLKKYPINLLSNTKSFIGNKLKKKKNWYPNNLTFSIKDSKSIAKYEIDHQEYIVYTTCPHMGCTLIFNEFEKTWDCPCHASRFDYKGKCLKGPSIKDITYHSH